MQLRKLVFAVAIILIALAPVLAIAQEHEHKPYVGSEEFEKMKQLVGSWEGKMDMGQGPMTITATYKLTAADSAIVETVFEGTPNEMVSVYHDNRDRKLTMTHYCAEHNQPRLTLVSGNANQLTLNLAKDSDIEVGKEEHIHAATIEFEGKDKMVQKWTSFKGGKQNMVVTLPYQRVQ